MAYADAAPREPPPMIKILGFFAENGGRGGGRTFELGVLALSASTADFRESKRLARFMVRLEKEVCSIRMLVHVLVEAQKTVWGQGRPFSGTFTIDNNMNGQYICIHITGHG
jgi:hypothetical protein